MDLKPYLDDLEQRVDNDAEEALLTSWRNFLDGRFTGDIFSPRRPKPAPPTLPWPKVMVNTALEDYNQMALQQFGECSGAIAGGRGNMLNVRCNYGTGILPSLFDAEIFLMDYEHNTLPTTKPIPGGLDGIKKLLDAGIPDLNRGFGKHVFAIGEYFQELLAPYPKLRQHVAIYHPDLQGPMDVCELLCGSDIFLYLFDEADLMHALLTLVTDTCAAFMRRWQSIVPYTAPESRHWGFLHRGAIMLRDDSAMNLSPDMFKEFILPYNQRLFDIFGGGGDHFCGRGDHFIPILKNLKGLDGIAMSQPEYNDMEIIYANTVDCGLKLFGLRRDAAENALRAGRSLHGLVHCW